jgi:hypothetical protein
VLASSDTAWLGLDESLWGRLAAALTEAANVLSRNTSLVQKK